MSSLLKDMYSHEYLQSLAVHMQAAYEPFLIDEFVKSTMNETWDRLELMSRCRQITVNLQKFLPKDYQEAIGVIDKVIEDHNNLLDGFYLFFPDFVAQYGQDEENWDISMAALERYTPYASAEFAVRPFIINHEECMMAQMLKWAKHEDEHVRRLASEGCRPALPWGKALKGFKIDPAPILPILELLKADPSSFVRKSVANNINDISKNHPDLIAQLAKDWYGKHEHIDWVVKHGCRTLLKKGNRDVLNIFGFYSDDFIDVQDFALEDSVIAIGKDMIFSFSILTSKATKVRLEYGIDYVKANGKRNMKIFQLSEISLKANETKIYTKKQSFADLSTRKHYQGEHTITLIINGMERGTLKFYLASPDTY